ncbi:class I SAM-dependent methyltransferase [Candidatus Peribacteria bacterium]|nr:class I SAM-dependent methyltransferase [Candidatus Peribacteria bacterium]
MRLAQQLGFFQTTDLEPLMSYVTQQAAPGDVPGVLRALETYGTTVAYMMHLGPHARQVLEQVLREHRPRRILEIGMYCGYSSLCMAHALPSSRITGIEHSRSSPALCQALFAYARVEQQIEIIRARAEKAIPTLPTAYDLVLMDHNKSLYLQDFTLLLLHQRLAMGGVIVADNVNLGAAKAFTEHLQSRPDFSVTVHVFPRHGDPEQTDSMLVGVYQP